MIVSFDDIDQKLRDENRLPKKPWRKIDIANLDKDFISFPILFDQLLRIGNDVVYASAGFFDSEKNIFRIPFNKLEAIKKASAKKWEIIQNVGYEIVMN